MTPPEITAEKSPKCACVHPDGFECARIRDGRHVPDEAEYYKRECECDCHDREDEDDEF